MRPVLPGRLPLGGRQPARPGARDAALDHLGGWPFVAFCATAAYGQLVSVYQCPAPALLVLGGSTLVAVLVGYRYGREKRVWCRYLCPVSGVFGLLAKLAPLHYRVDEQAWRAATRQAGRFRRVNCAPLVAIATMKGASQCHMCGRCAGFRDGVALSARPPNREIVEVAGVGPRPWETALILFGLHGLALGAFVWPASGGFVLVKQAVAGWLLRHGIVWPLDLSAPWWLLTNYPARNDVLNLLDGALILAAMFAVAALMGGSLSLLIALAVRSLGAWSWPRFHHLAQALIPLAGGGIFLGLSALTVSTLRAEGFDPHWIDSARALLLAGAWLWSQGLALAILRRQAGSRIRLATAGGAMMVACVLAATAWYRALLA